MIPPMRQTPWACYTEDGQQFRIRADYGWSQYGGQDPYFAVTATIEETSKHGGWRYCAGGQCTAEVREHLPEIAPLIQWHLVSTVQPMHYAANAIYHWEQGEVEAFKSVVVFGAVPGDRLPPDPILRIRDCYHCRACTGFWDVAKGTEIRACAECSAPTHAGRVQIVSGMDPKTVCDNSDMCRDWCMGRLLALMAQFRSCMETFGCGWPCEGDRS